MGDYRVFKRTEKSRDYGHNVNEDRFIMAEYCFMNDKKLKLLAVADGMGGLSAGDKAAHDVIFSFVKSFHDLLTERYLSEFDSEFSIAFSADFLQDTLKRAIADANRYVCEQADPFIETGTTISAIAILDGFAVLANVGDSPIYFYRSETEEFSVVSQLQTKAEMDVLNGRYERYSFDYYNNDHILVNSIGKKENLDEEDVFSRVLGYLGSGDMILVGSDGAFGRMKDEEVYRIISASEKEHRILKQLFETAREDKDDDQTAILYKVCGEV